MSVRRHSVDKMRVLHGSARARSFECVVISRSKRCVMGLWVGKHFFRADHIGETFQHYHLAWGLLFRQMVTCCRPTVAPANLTSSISGDFGLLKPAELSMVFNRHSVVKTTPISNYRLRNHASRTKYRNEYQFFPSYLTSDSKRREAFLGNKKSSIPIVLLDRLTRKFLSATVAARLSLGSDMKPMHAIVN